MARTENDAGIGLGRIGTAAGLEVPVEDAANEGRDQKRARIGAGDRLGQRKDQRQIAVDAVFLQGGGGLRAFPVPATLMRMRSRSATPRLA